jgi:hypothetical protein
VLHGVRNVDGVPVDPGGIESAIENAAGGADEREPGPVLAVAGLLADEHDGRRHGALSEYRLRSVAVERAALAMGGLGGDLQ